MTNKKRKRCAFPDCKKKSVIIVGDCKNCELNYCLEHRLPEYHQCEKMEEKRKAELKKIEKKLMSEKCVDDKIIRF